MAKRVINVSVCPGQPTDGSGQVCIHLFLRDSKGRFTEPHVLHPATKDIATNGPLEARATRGRLACSPTRTVAPMTRDGVTHITVRTDDPRAVTCPKCRATTDWSDLMTKLTEGT